PVHPPRRLGNAGGGMVEAIFDESRQQEGQGRKGSRQESANLLIKSRNLRLTPPNKDHEDQWKKKDPGLVELHGPTYPEPHQAEGQRRRDPIQRKTGYGFKEPDKEKQAGEKQVAGVVNVGSLVQGPRQ